MTDQIRVILLPLNDSGRERIKTFIKLADKNKNPQLLSDGTGQIDMDIPWVLKRATIETLQKFITTAIFKSAAKPLDGEIALQVVKL